jgi:hypothetical protein
MDKKINLCEILKDCPDGMELNCMIWKDCTFIGVEEDKDGSIIRIKTPLGVKFLDRYGRYISTDEAKCVIFPKGKMTWDGFVPPCKFKDGDIVATGEGNWIGITSGGDRNEFIPTYCVLTNHDELVVYSGYQEEWLFNRLATEEEKVKLFEKIKERGYRWNADEKRLEKLAWPTFKKGEIVRSIINEKRYVITDVTDTDYSFSCISSNFKFTKEIVEAEKIFELVGPKKLDIGTLKPFDKVLVRNCDNEDWMPALFGRRKKCLSEDFITSIGVVHQCIPYEGNEHLLGVSDDCEDFYKIWRNSI